MHPMSEDPVIKCKCGGTCRKMIGSNISGGGVREIWNYNDVRQMRPKYLRGKDNVKVRYDPNKHGYSKGGG